jgi:hypothetical protein
MDRRIFRRYFDLLNNPVPAMGSGFFRGASLYLVFDSIARVFILVKGAVGWLVD